jgi:hypothetical protein
MEKWHNVFCVHDADEGRVGAPPSLPVFAMGDIPQEPARDTINTLKDAVQKWMRRGNEGRLEDGESLMFSEEAIESVEFFKAENPEDKRVIVVADDRRLGFIHTVMDYGEDNG